MKTMLHVVQVTPDRHPDGTERAAVSIPYRGYRVSVSTAHYFPEILIWNSEGADLTAYFTGLDRLVGDAEGIREALEKIDNKLEEQELPT